jgi:putative membrane protein
MVVSHANALEIASSQLAKTNATSAAVKAFANDMIRDHTAMQKQGMTLEKQLGTTNGGSTTAGSGTASGSSNAGSSSSNQLNGDSASMAAVSPADSSKLGDLATKQKGADWDKQYMSMQVDAHQKTLDRLNNMQGKAQNAQLKQMITGAIPKVQAHLDRAKKLQGQLK